MSEAVLHGSPAFPGVCPPTGRYIQSFLNISIANVGYLVFFVVFTTKPNLRRRFWGLLVWYCIAVLLLLFFWKAVVLRAKDVDSLPTYVVGIDQSDALWAWNIIPGCALGDGWGPANRHPPSGLPVRVN